MSKTQIPFPPGLSFLGSEATRPLFIKSGCVAALMEYWGFTDDGAQFVKKLAQSDLLRWRKFAHQRTRRYCVASVLEYYQREMRA